MKQGKMPQDVLKNCIYPYLGMQRKDVLVGPAIGEDSAVLDYGDEVAVLSTDPITAASNDLGKIAVHVACNDVASCGGEPVGLMVVILLPPSSGEDGIRRIMQQIHHEAEQIGAQVLGGHTEITDTVTQPIVACTAVGRAPKDRYVTSSGAKPGDKLVLTKTAGLEGTAILARDYEDYLLAHLDKDLIKRAQDFVAQISVIREGLIARNTGVHAMHDPTEGGVLGGAAELAAASGVGVEIDAEAVPLAEETRAICRVLAIDPLKLISSGSMLIATPDEVLLGKRLAEAGIRGTVIGEVTGEGLYIRRQSGIKEFVPPERDCLFEAIEKLGRIG